ncbi:MAG: alpha/beta hydrolase [Opitutales bacterium]
MKKTRTFILLNCLIYLSLGALGCGAVDPDSRAGRLTQDQLSSITGARRLPLDKEIPKRKPSYEVTVHTDLRYYSGQDAHEEKHLLDLYIPEGKGSWPLVHFVHGGAWFFGHKNQRIPLFGAYENLGRGLASRGIAVAISNYRLSPEFKHPAHVQDVAAAWAWLCENVADYGVDTDKMFLMGQSAGGHLVSLLATNTGFQQDPSLAKQVRAVISMSGIYDLGAMSPRSGDPPRLIERAFGTNSETLEEASPIFHVEETTPPFVLITAERDPQSLRVQAAKFAKVLKEHSVTYDFWIIPSKNHIDSIGDIGRATDATTAAIEAYILNSK